MEYFHGPDFQISLQRRRRGSTEEEFRQAREGVDNVDVCDSLQQSRLRQTHL